MGDLWRQLGVFPTMSEPGRPFVGRRGALIVLGGVVGCGGVWVSQDAIRRGPILSTAVVVREGTTGPASASTQRRREGFVDSPG